MDKPPMNWFRISSIHSSTFSWYFYLEAFFNQHCHMMSALSDLFSESFMKFRVPWGRTSAETNVLDKWEILLIVDTSDHGALGFA